MHHYISDFSKHIGHEVTVKGWVINIRTSKTNCFFDFRDGTGFTQCVVSLENVGDVTKDNCLDHETNYEMFVPGFETIIE